MSEDSAFPPGGADSALDPSSLKDARTIGRAARKWPGRFRTVDPDRIDKWVEQLDRGIDKAETDGNLGALASLLRTSIDIVKVVQRDEHHAEELAAGKHDAQRGPSVIVVSGVDASRMHLPPEPKQLPSAHPSE